MSVPLTGEPSDVCATHWRAIRCLCATHHKWNIWKWQGDSDHTGPWAGDADQTDPAWPHFHSPGNWHEFLMSWLQWLHSETIVLQNTSMDELSKLLHRAVQFDEVSLFSFRTDELPILLQDTELLTMPIRWEPATHRTLSTMLVRWGPTKTQNSVNHADQMRACKTQNSVNHANQMRARKDTELC